MYRVSPGSVLSPGSAHGPYGLWSLVWAPGEFPKGLAADRKWKGKHERQFNQANKSLALLDVTLNREEPPPQSYLFLCSFVVCIFLHPWLSLRDVHKCFCTYAPLPSSIWPTEPSPGHIHLPYIPSIHHCLILRRTIFPIFSVCRWLCARWFPALDLGLYFRPQRLADMRLGWGRLSPVTWCLETVEPLQSELCLPWNCTVPGTVPSAGLGVMFLPLRS